MNRVMRTFAGPEREARTQDPCRLCIELLARPVQPKTRPAEHDQTWCPDCGRDLAEVARALMLPAREAFENRERAARRAEYRTPRPVANRMRQLFEGDPVGMFVDSVLRWGLQVARVDRSARGSASPLAGMIARVELYGFDSTGERIEGAKIGRGVRGTHGAIEGGGYDEPDPIHVDPDLQARYDGLGAQHRATADAIVEDGAGDILVERFFGNRAHLLALTQRVAFKLARSSEIEKWALKLAAGDIAPALAASKRLGGQRIEGAAAAWWREELP